MLLSEMSDALLSLKDLFFCHALESLLPVLVHVDLELVKEVLGLDVRAVFVENVAVFDIRLAEDGVLMCFVRRNAKLTYLAYAKATVVTASLPGMPLLTIEALVLQSITS